MITERKRRRSSSSYDPALLAYAERIASRFMVTITGFANGLQFSSHSLISNPGMYIKFPDFLYLIFNNYF